MRDTILFDLDGTLLQFSQDSFIELYFSKLRNVFARLGLDAELAIKAVWSGTKAMVLNDGSKLNSERFWEVFAGIMELSGERLKTVEDECDSFYSTEFDTVKSVLKNDSTELPKQLLRSLSSRCYTVALATNPLFPTCAVDTRLKWIGLAPSDFCWITDYSNSTYCKPNTGYYTELLKKIGKKPEQCIMVGNNTREDMIAGTLGIETFLVTDYLENEIKTDIAAFRHGTLAELEAYLTSVLSN